MNALVVLDYYVWKFLIVRSRPAWFKTKLFSLAALLYVSVFPLPRKFLLHYFRGKGQSMKVDTRELILRNQQVLDILKRSLKNTENEQAVNGQQENDGKNKIRIPIGQHLVNTPDHRYSIGSLTLLCETDGEWLRICMKSHYRFSGDHDRITRYLHRWMDKLRENGTADSFNIEGNTWTISRQSLMSSNAYPRKRKYIDYNILYI